MKVHAAAVQYCPLHTFTLADYSVGGQFMGTPATMLVSVQPSQFPDAQSLRSAATALGPLFASAGECSYKEAQEHAAFITTCVHDSPWKLVRVLVCG